MKKKKKQKTISPTKGYGTHAEITHQTTTIHPTVN